jgi:phosphatidylserine/phosphatidylglycerophosphate/cardiolipin synthase-like enzyme
MRKLVLLLAAFAAGCGPETMGMVDDGTAVDDGKADNGTSTSTSWVKKVGLKGHTSLFESPDPTAHQPWIDAISTAKRSVHMTMYHLTDSSIVDALIAAKTTRGLDVRVILDGASLSNKGYAAQYQRLGQAGVEVRPSSAAFSITHVKAMVVDGTKSFVTSMNLTNTQTTTRDWALITTDYAVADEVESVFETDWDNANDDGQVTPALANANLLWSPVNSESKLVTLIQSAHHGIDATVENLGDQAILDAFSSAAAAGIPVRLIVPQCDQNANPYVNYPYLKVLAKAGVQTRVMPYPATAAQPYMHAKMIVADGKLGYVGSINFSTNSTQNARELGIAVVDTGVIGTIESGFATDWASSLPWKSTDPRPTGCPVVN